MNGYCIYLTALKAEVAECAFVLVSFYFFGIITIRREDTNRTDLDAFTTPLNTQAPVKIDVKPDELTHDLLHCGKLAVRTIHEYPFCQWRRLVPECPWTSLPLHSQ
jgi:hypothetical protein